MASNGLICIQRTELSTQWFWRLFILCLAVGFERHFVKLNAGMYIYVQHVCEYIWVCFLREDNLYAHRSMCTYMASQVAPVVKNPPASSGDLRDTGLIPGSRRSPGVGSGIPLQYSCLGNSKDRGAWQVTVHGASRSQTWLSGWAWSHVHICIFVYIYMYMKLFSYFWGMEKYNNSNAIIY